MFDETVKKGGNDMTDYLSIEGMTEDLEGKVKQDLKYNSLENIIEIEPLEPYAQDETYILNITTNVTSLSGKALREPQQLRFKI